MFATIEPVFPRSEEASVADPAQFVRADPLFLHPPSFRPSGSYEEPLRPALPGDSFTLQANSPALHIGIDPATVPNLSETVIRDLKKYIYTDINGTARPWEEHPIWGLPAHSPALGPPRGPQLGGSHFAASRWS